MEYWRMTRPVESKMAMSTNARRKAVGVLLFQITSHKACTNQLMAKR